MPLHHRLLVAAAAIGILLIDPRPARANEALASKSQCLACHAIDRKQVGPSFKEVAARYAKDRKAAAEHLASKIRNGGSGGWGPLMMPPHPGLSEVDAKELAQWVLSL